MALFTVLKSNLKSKKGNFFSIFIFVFIIGVSLSTIISVNSGTMRRLHKACEDSKISDIVCFIPESKLTQKMLDGVKATDGVLDIENQQSVISSKIKINGEADNNMVLMTSYQPKQHSYQIFNAGVTGFVKDSFKEPGRGEVYLPICLKSTYHCKIGDTFHFVTPRGTKDYEITGFIEEPFIGSSVMGIKEIFINHADLMSLIQTVDDSKLTEYAIVNITVNKNYSIDKVKKALNVNSGLISSSTSTMTKEEANNYTLIFTNIISGILGAFAVLLFTIILIIIGHSVSTSIEMDYVMLGILKAQGFTSLQIRSILMLQYLAAGVFGAVTGIIVSCFTIPLVNAVLLPVTGLYVGNDLRLLQMIGLMALLLLLVAIYTFLKTKKILKISPVQAISSGHAPVYFKNIADFPITKSMPIPLGVKLVIKEIAGNIRRYLSTILIMGILSFFTLSVTSLNQMTQLDFVDNAFGNISSDIDVSYKQDEDSSIIQSVEQQINNRDTILTKFQLSKKYFTIDDMEYLGFIVDRTDVVNKPITGRIPKYDNEVMITEILSKEMGKGIGDTITIKYDNSKADYMIVGLNQYISDVGRNFFILESGMKRLDPNFSFHSVSYTIRDKSKTGEIVKYLKAFYKNQKDKIEFTDDYEQGKKSLSDILTALYAITGIIYMLAIIFDIIVSFMICQKLFLREKQNMGIYKSLGFTSGRLKLQFILRFLLVVLLGCCVGLLCNFIWNNSLMSLLLVGMGISHFVTRYSALNILIPIVCISGFATLFSYLISSKITRVSPKNLIQE